MTVSEVSLSLLVLRCTNLQSTLGFYRLLGLSFTEEQHGTGPLHYSAALGEAVLELYPAQNDQNVERIRIGFTVNSLPETLQTLQENGVKVLSSPRQTAWGIMAVVLDPDGRTVEIITGTK
jgi:catechol 2,3-dioxygenase-like lactoylglutathione lyase family enzyme